MPMHLPSISHSHTHYTHNRFSNSRLKFSTSYYYYSECPFLPLFQCTFMRNKVYKSIIFYGTKKFSD